MRTLMIFTLANDAIYVKHLMKSQTRLYIKSGKACPIWFLMASFHHVTFKAYRINQSWRFPKVESLDASFQYGRIYFKLFHVVRYFNPGNTYSKSLGNYLNIYPQMHYVLPPQEKLRVSSGHLKSVGLFYHVGNCAGFRVLRKSLLILHVKSLF